MCADHSGLNTAVPVHPGRSKAYSAMTSTEQEGPATASMPRFVQCADSEEVSQRMAEILARKIRKRPGMLLCASAGSSPRRTYRLLGEQAAADPGAFAQFRVIKIDEWGGLPNGSAATCEADLQENLLLPLRVSPERYQGFASDPADPAAECQRIAGWLCATWPDRPLHSRHRHQRPHRDE